jgi:pimeloyl-ACP methyl ester carboxylesterase
MAHVVIYVPGLGDNAVRQAAQSTLLWLWQPLYGIRMRYFAARWQRHDESFADKLARLVTLVDSELASGNHVSLIGASAGASLSINALVQRPLLTAAISVCGKLRNPQTILPEIYSVSPAFRPSLEAAAAAEPTLNDAQRTKVLLVRPTRDAVVPVGDNWVRGATITTLPTFGHALSILASLTIFSRRLAAFIRAASMK